MKRYKIPLLLSIALVAVAVMAQTYVTDIYTEPGGGRLVVASGGELDVESGGEIDVESGGSLKLAGTAITSNATELNLLDGVSGLAQADLTKLAAIDATAVEINKTNGIAATAYFDVTEGISFTEDGSGTSYIGTVEIPAGAVVHDVCFVSTVLWDGTSASLDIGDDDDPNGWFAAVNLKATDLAVGEALCAADDGTWGGKNGVYLTAAGRRGRVTSGVDSGWYYGAASEVIFLVTPGAADGSAGRSFGWVSYGVPTFVASTNS